MGNKYGSNLRTYTARNLVWNVEPSTPPIPYNINAPVDLGIAAAGMLPVFYKAQFPLGFDWNRNSRIAVKRVGIFCNFADGLVQKMNTNRLSLYVVIGTYGQVAIGSNTISLSRGSNIITGPDLSSIQDGTILFDTIHKIPYYVTRLPGNLPNEVYLTDYAIDDFEDESIQKLDPGYEQYFNISNIATLNTMYEAEISFPLTPPADDPFQHLFVSCRLVIDGVYESPYAFYTKSINPSFNGSPVCFDSVVELEVTPY